MNDIALTLNQTSPELEEWLPPTDARFWPDMRLFEIGEGEKCTVEKLWME